MQREASVFGADPDAWQPERWLCSEANQQQMYNSLLTVCLKTQISWSFMPGFTLLTL